MSRIIGVTGGIGVGKSTVSNILLKHGAIIIDADIISRQIVNNGTPALKEIVDHFGKSILNNNNLDRKKLSSIVFNNDSELRILNNITHKYIIKEIVNQVDLKKEKELIVLDAALPFEHGFLDIVTEVWVIASFFNKRIQRVTRRNQISKSDVIKIIAAQNKNWNYFKYADYIIYNNFDIITLESLIKKFLRN